MEENIRLVNLEDVTARSRQAMADLLDATRLKPGKIVVVGCSTSEIQGRQIGSSSAIEVADAVIEGILPLIRENGPVSGGPMLRTSEPGIGAGNRYGRVQRV